MSAKSDKKIFIQKEKNKNVQQNVISIQFYKNFKGPSFYGHWVKSLLTSTWHSFWY